jgi:hypothetical protein
MNDLIITKLDRATKLLAEAKTVKQTKRVLDLAVAAGVYAKRQKLGEEAIRYATEIKFDALRKLGEMLKGTKLAKGGDQYHKTTGSRLVPVPTLAVLGIDKKTSHLAQMIASLRDGGLKEAKESRDPLYEATRIYLRMKQEELAAERMRATLEKHSVAPRAEVANARARKEEAERALRKAERDAEEALRPFREALDRATEELQEISYALGTHEDIYESDEPCPALTMAEALDAVTRVNGCVGYDWWRAAGYPDPGDLVYCGYHQWLRSGDQMVLNQSAWKLGPKSPGSDYHRWVVSVSSPGQARWLRYFWFRGVSRPDDKSLKDRRKLRPFLDGGRPGWTTWG